MGENCPPRKMRVVMLPWLAHGHISPFLELAKTLVSSNKSFHVYLCSTPAALSFVRPSIPQHCCDSIDLIELHLQSLPDLPPHLHTTRGLPPHLMPTLKRAFELPSTPSFPSILDTLKPDLLIHDVFPSWASSTARSRNIPAVSFVTMAAVSTAFVFHSIEAPRDRGFPFPAIHLYEHEYDALPKAILETSLSDDPTGLYQFVESIKGSDGIVLIKSFQELDGKYMDYLSVLSGKRVVPVGPLVQEPVYDHQDETNYNEGIKKWLDSKEPESTVLVSFGTECFLGKEDMEEMANGLEKSKANFIWVLKFPMGERVNLEEELPKGFLEKVGERGMVVQGWAPQKRILEHPSTGGFLSHCGWSSVMESLKCGVPIIAMPMQIDQPLNARLVVEVGVGVEVMRGDNGRIEGEEVAKAINEVVMVNRTKERVLKKAREMSQAIEKGQMKMLRFSDQLIQLCGTHKS